MMPWHNLTRDGDSARVSIFGDISAFAFPADELLAQLEGVRRAEVVIDSSGGSSPDALTVHDALARIETTVTIQNAASAAAIIAMAGKVRRIHADGRMMVHTARHFVSGDPTQLRRYADELDAVNARAVAILTTRTGQPIEVVRHWMAGEDHWFTADEALAAGLVDEIIPAVVATIPGAASPSTPDAPAMTEAPTEAEAMFYHFLRVFPSPFRVSNRENFGRELAVFFQNQVKE